MKYIYYMNISYIKNINYIIYIQSKKYRCWIFEFIPYHIFVGLVLVVVLDG